jgi:FkbM family methyltransferase
MSTPATALPLRLRLAQMRAFLWRFRSLALAHGLFDGIGGPRILRRRLFGFELAMDVARGNPQRLLILEGERFVAERQLVRRLLRPGMHAVDVGANIGYYMLLLAQAVGPGGTVSCFEPDPDNLVELERNVRLNGLASVRIHPAAVGAENTTVELRGGINGTVSAGGELRVPLVRLDSAVTRPVDFLKVDVEGYEGHVLAGARQILTQDRPNLLLEVHPALLAPPHTVDAMLRELGGLYERMELHEIAPEENLRDKLRARYLGHGVRRVADPEALLAACRVGQREEPFWAVYHRL